MVGTFFTIRGILKDEVRFNEDGLEVPVEVLQNFSIRHRDTQGLQIELNKIMSELFMMQGMLISVDPQDEAPILDKKVFVPMHRLHSLRFWSKPLFDSPATEAQ
jgi:hypothetical protein